MGGRSKDKRFGTKASRSTVGRFAKDEVEAALVIRSERAIVKRQRSSERHGNRPAPRMPTFSFTEKD